MNLLNYLDYPFLALAVFIGLVTSWSDLREGKIRNRHLIFGALAGLFFYAAEISLLTAFGVSVRWSYFGDVLMNTGIGFLIGFFLWQFNIWAAGDAKLFALYTFLIPLGFYQKNYLPFFPSFALLLNVFLAILTFVLLKMIFDLFISAVFFLGRFFGKRGPGDSEAPLPSEETLGKNPSVLKRFLKDFLAIPLLSLGVYAAVKIVFISLQAWGGFGKLNFLDGPLFPFFCLFLIFQIVNKMKRPLKIGLASSFCAYIVIGLIFWPRVISAGFSTALNLTAFYYIFGFLIFNKIFDFYVEKRDILKIPVEKLKTGVIIGPKSLMRLRQILPGLQVGGEGLTEEEVKNIKDLGEKTTQFRFVEIYKVLPVAPFIFLGAILTLIVKGILISSIV